MNTETRKQFGELSKILTGEPGLDPALVDPFYERLLAVFPAEMPKLLQAFSALPAKDEINVATAIVKNSATPKEVISLVKEIINVWYLGNFFAPGADRTMMPPTALPQYQSQLMFPLIKAPVRAYSNLAGVKFGYWADKPAGE